MRQESLVERWCMSHETVDHYPKLEFESPELWALKRHGLVMTSVDRRRPHESVGPEFEKWRAFFPVTNCKPEVAAALSLPNSPGDLSEEHWTEAFEFAFDVVDDELLGDFYSFACNQSSPKPSAVCCRVGDGHDRRIPSEVTAVSVSHEFRALCNDGLPVLRFRDESTCQHLVHSWGFLHAAECVQTELLHVAVGDAVPLIDQFPSIRFHSTSEQIDSLELLECSELRLETVTDGGKSSRPETFFKSVQTIYWHSSLGITRLLERLDELLDLRLGPEGRDAVLSQHLDQERQRKLVEIRSKDSDAARLLAAIGSAAIRPRIPAGLVTAVEAEHGALSDIQLAELALVVYGPATLQEYRGELERAGLNPPQRWAGKSEARRFVRSIGFDRAFAGFEQARRDPLQTVDGPIRLPDLHEYQEAIVSEIISLVSGTEEDRRGLVSLPTGAGKTRVAVEALVRMIRDGRIVDPVLWVAQSDELCEQAVQSWREVWRSVGAESQLHISRLWASNSAEPVEDGAHVVVATIQKLDHCFDDNDYDWLQASVLVIDEAHGATTPSYTRLLTWQGIGRKGVRCPLIGLTATPFRGRSEEQTERLAARFGRRRLDSNLGDDPYGHLQSIRVLAEVEHEVLPGVDLNLDEGELESYRQLGSLPSAVFDRVAADAARNRTLLNDILGLPSEWPVLLFAASVEHAQTMAALLQMEGRTACPITADTAAGQRRDTVEGFRKGKIQILTNYGVLTQGFDAPAVRVIYVARPTFSPTIYQQMIGRGLRGPLNGGKPTCRIVNVEDNFNMYGETLAFREFEHLWGKRD